MKITWLGTAAIRIEAAGERLLFDPFVQLVGGENPNCLDDFLEDEVIFITHGHLDHLMEIPELLEDEAGEACSDATVYCGSVAADTLDGMLQDAGQVVKVSPGDCIRIGRVSVKVHPGRHARPGRTALKTLLSPRMVRYAGNALALAWLNRRFPEGGQTLVYEMEAEGKTVLLLGSMDLAPEADYPKGAELLILPFQGCPDPAGQAARIVERLRPKRILLDHFDDAFPPVSRSVDTRPFKKLMQERYPDIRAAKPVAGRPVEL